MAEKTKINDHGDVIFSEDDVIDLLYTDPEFNISKLYIRVLQFLIYFIDTLRANNMVWGVGRGSSVASFCLFLIGVHKINPMLYDLDITEFLR